MRRRISSEAALIQDVDLLAYMRKSWLILLFGFVLFCAGSLVLLNNERQTARKIVSLDEAMAGVFSVKSNTNPTDALDGRIVHVVGQLFTNEPLTEPEFNIQVQAVKLKRRVQMYQWVEQTTETVMGQSVDIMSSDTTTYYYINEWSDRPIDSALFHHRYGHENPKEFPIKNRVHIAPHVHIGKFELGKEGKSEINNYIEITSDTRPEDPSIKMHLGMYYYCDDVFNPQVGDIRLQFLTAGIEGNYYTVVAKSEKGLLVPYVTSINTTVLIMLPGRLTLEEAFSAAHYERKMQSWALRFIGWALMFFAVTCTSDFLLLALNDLPRLNLLSSSSQQPLYGNILLSASLTFIISALCWIIFRPWFGLGLLLAAVSPFLFCAQNVGHHYQRVPVSEHDQ